MSPLGLNIITIGDIHALGSVTFSIMSFSNASLSPCSTLVSTEIGILFSVFPVVGLVLFWDQSFYYYVSYLWKYSHLVNMLC